MKRRIAILCLAGAMGASLLLGGCGSNSSKMEKYKDKGIEQMKAGEYDEAIKTFQKGLDQSVGKLGAEELDLSYYKALAQYKSGDIQAAVDTYTGLLGMDEDNWEIYYLRGCAYLGLEDKDSALADFDTAVSENSSDISLYANICESLKAAGYEDEGQTYLDTALSLKVSTGEQYCALGQLQMAQEDYDSAVSSLETAVDKGYKKAYLELGKAYSAKGDTDNAKAAFSSYMDAYPDDLDALIQLGETAADSKEYDQAIEYLETALSQADGDEGLSICKDILAVYEKQGDFETAYEKAQEYATTYPDDEELAKECTFLETQSQSSDDLTDQAGGSSSEKSDSSSEDDGSEEDTSTESGGNTEDDES